MTRGTPPRRQDHQRLAPPFSTVRFRWPQRDGCFTKPLLLAQPDTLGPCTCVTPHRLPCHLTTKCLRGRTAANNPASWSTRILQGTLGKKKDLVTKQMKYLENAHTWTWRPLDSRLFSQALLVNRGTSMSLLIRRRRSAGNRGFRYCDAI